MKVDQIKVKKSKKRKSNGKEKLSMLSKKKKLAVPVEEEESSEHNEFVSDDDAEVQVSPKKTVQEDIEDGWSKEDCNELLRRMEEQIPKDDNKSFTVRVDKLDWTKIQFGSHSVDDCQQKWKVIKTKIRHYRLLSEVLQDAKTYVKNPWATSFKNKKVRHPEQPMRPLSSFMIYFMEKKEHVIKKHPNMKLTDISKLIGEKYQALSDGKKELYKKKASLMQEEYKLNMSKFYEKHPELIPTSKKTMPKSNKPLPPFKLFMKEKLEKSGQHENLNQHDLIEKYKEIWKSLSLKKKAYWIRKAKEQEEKFLEHSNEEPTDDGEEKSSASYKSVISKDDAAILDRLAGKPEKPPNSAYSLYSRLMLQGKDDNFLDGEPKNRMKEIAKMWKEVPEAKKKEYAEEVKHMQENYKLEFANYLESLPEDRRAEELAKVQPKKKVKKQKTTKRKSIASMPEKDLFKNEPEQPPVTAWDLFKKEFIKKNSHLSNSMACKQAATIWKGLPVKETEKYKKKHQQLKDKYLIDYEAFLQSLSPEELQQYSKMKKSIEINENEEEEEEVEESSAGEDQDQDDSDDNDSEESASDVSEED